MLLLNKRKCWTRDRWSFIDIALVGQIVLIEIQHFLCRNASRNMFVNYYLFWILQPIFPIHFYMPWTLSYLRVQPYVVVKYFVSHSLSLTRTVRLVIYFVLIINFWLLANNITTQFKCVYTNIHTRIKITSQTCHEFYLQSTSFAYVCVCGCSLYTGFFFHSVVSNFCIFRRRILSIVWLSLIFNNLFINCYYKLMSLMTDYEWRSVCKCHCVTNEFSIIINGFCTTEIHLWQLSFWLVVQNRTAMQQYLFRIELEWKIKNRVTVVLLLQRTYIVQTFVGNVFFFVFSFFLLLFDFEVLGS